MINSMNTPLTEFKGIGPKKSQLFSRLGIFDVEDALYSFPRGYEDRRNVKSISSLEAEEEAMVLGTVAAVKKGRYVRGRKRTTRFLIKDETGTMEVLFFNAGYLEKNIKTGDKYWFFGKINKNGGSIAMMHPSFGKADEEDFNGDILPVYPLTSGLTQGERRKLSANALKYVDESLEVLNENIRLSNQLCGIEYALKNIHYPEDERHMRVAKYRLIFEELLLFSLGILMMKNKFLERKAGYVMSKEPYESEFCADLPFGLTSGQKKAVEDISNDMSSGKRMNRLIQGDVGSGKTVVSAAAAYKAIKNGYQAAIMAPTEILAYQHYDTFKDFFDDKGITVKILNSSTSSNERKETLEMCEDGRADILIGTHAVFGKDVRFKDLALVVTDEQHRFGVAQREALNAKGRNPHIMVMTATPIPRTLALIMYGDMDVSVISDKPLGRKEIITKVFRGDERENAYRLVMDQIKKGHQAYIVTPLIESSENIDVRSSEEVFEEAKEYFGEYKIALLHGKMKQEEKDRIMNDFKEGNIQVLVSTVIIEVGINVPNATVMVIENSERFGLAQMHQLRGRVGRGSEQSFCILVLDKDTDVAVKRAEAMESFSDGFIIAEKDLALRGTGEFFGTRQHGIPDMRIADVVKHSKILKKAMEEAGRIVEKDSLLANEEHRKMKERIFSLYGEEEPRL